MLLVCAIGLAGAFACAPPFASGASVRAAATSNRAAFQELEAGSALARAVELCGEGREQAALEALRRALADDPAACQLALLEPAFAGTGDRPGLRDSPDFRAAIEAAAVSAGVSSIALARSDEPGEWLAIEGRALDESGAPIAGVLVRLFATDAEGRYHPVIEGERVPRLFGFVLTDADGRFQFRTVRPGPYPGTRNARHVHVSAEKGGLRLAAPHYAVFDDDPLLGEPQNAEQRGEALRIRMRTAEDQRGTVAAPHRGELVLPMR